MSQVFNRCSYRTQFVYLIVGFVLAVSMSSFYYLKWLQDNFIESALNSQAVVISELVSEDMAQLIYLSDPDILASITFKLKKIKAIKSADFFDLKGEPILSISNNVKVDHHLIKKIKMDIEYDGISLGYVKLRLHSHDLYEEQKLTNRLYIIFLIVLVSVGLFLVYIFDKFFISRLSKLSSALQYVSEEQDFSKRLVEDRNDDIGKAKQYFNQLVGLVEQQTKSLVYQANHDSLTGLYNRNRIISHLDTMLLNRPNSDFHAVCYLDLDQFKVVNDTCGHATGDELLKQLSAQMLDIVMTKDEATFGRLGGDEFIGLNPLVKTMHFSARL